MISIPAVAQIEGIVVFRDDEQTNRFYYLPRMPRIAVADNGKPMFTFLRYEMPIERKDKKGGGYLVFTTRLIEEQSLLDNKIMPALKRILQQENPLSVNVPEPLLAPVDFTGGEARLLIMKDNQFVRAIDVGKPSLFSDNTASVAVELEDLGATLFYEALKGGGSIAAIEYNLKFPVRLPAVTIIGHVDSGEVKTAVMGYTMQEVKDESVWGDETTHVRRRSSISETMEAQGLIKLEILKGSVDLSDDDMESLRSFAFRAMDEFIKNNFLKGGTVETAEDRASQWMEFLHQDIKKTFDLNVSYRDVITREYNPSAQINPAFLGVPFKDVVLEINLNNAPWYYKRLKVTVDTNLDFAKYGDIVHSVVGHLSYDQTGPDGQRLTKRESKVFTATDRSPKEFETSIVDVGRDQYHVDLEVNYKAGPTLQARLASFEDTRRNLTLSVPNPGVMEIKFSTAPEAFEGSDLKAVEVEVDYADPRNRVARAVETVLLNKAKPEADYRRVLFAPWDKPYNYRVTYVLQDADGNVQRSSSAWIEASNETRTVNIPTPFDEQFNLTVLPSADWKDVRQIVVDLDYKDAANDYTQQKTVFFEEAQAVRDNWKFALRDTNVRAFRFKQTLLMTDNSVQEGTWQTRDNDAQTLIVGNAPGGVVKVEVDPGDVAGLGSDVRRVLVRLSYADPAHHVSDTETLIFRSADPAEWTIARADAAVATYTYDVEYFLSDGTRHSLTAQPGTISSVRDFLFVPPLP
ncbi:MAG: hypothetical protein ABTQ73_13380 [Caldilineales bacterium]